MLLFTLFLLSSLVGRAGGQESLPDSASAQELLGGESLLDWLGLEPGDELSFVDGSGEPICARVGDSFGLAGREWVPLQGLPWPGLPTDSQILVPLDGSLSLGVIRTPGPRPRVEALIATAESLWRGIGGEPGSPEMLVYRWCRIFCRDAGIEIFFERGEGIAYVEYVTFMGNEILRRDASGCSPPSPVDS